MPTSSRINPAYAISLVLIVAAGALLAQRLVPAIRVAENWVYDLRVATLTPRMPQSTDIVVVAVTEDTLATFPYRSPVDRRFLSELLRRLQQKGARLIGIDILFDQPTEPQKDSELRSTWLEAEVPIVVAWAGSEAGITERQLAFMHEYLRGVRRGLAYVAKDSTDGAVRSLYIGEPDGQERQLGLVAVLAKSAGAEIPDRTTVPLAYRGSPDTETPPFPVYPAHSVSLLPDDWFAGKIVLIGADLSLEDRHRTPFAARLGTEKGSFPGVMIHAHALAQLLENRTPRQLAVWQQALVILLFSTAGLLITLVNLPVGAKASAGFAAVALAWIGGFVLYQQGGLSVPLVVPSIAFAATAGVASAHMWRRERTRRRFIRQAFSKYLAPSVVAQLEMEPDRLTLGGERRHTTILFTDIAGFTTLTESLEPDVLVPLLNAYFDGTGAIVLRHGGTIDKLVGDALHVFFNAPADQPDHAERAVKCALDLDKFCQSFRDKCAENGIALGQTRIGVNTGWTVVGNFGGKDHFDYTAHGDTTNTTARLESVNRYLGTRICVSGTTVAQCPGVSFRPIGKLVLKGKTEAIDVYEPLFADEAASPKTADYLAAYRLLENEDPRAAEAFTELANKYADDGLIAFHTRRLAKGDTGCTIVLTEK